MSPTVEKLLLVVGLAFPPLLVLSVLPRIVDAQGLLGGAGRHYVGTWSLVRGPRGWLIDAPHLKRVPS